VDPVVTSVPGDAPRGATSAARGTVAMVAGQAAYFVIGYAVVVVLAREMGPALYGSYGVIMSVLVWVEQSGRHAFQTSVSRMVAVEPSRGDSVLRAAVCLNLFVNAGLYLGFWLASPWLARWFGIVDADWYFRVAAIDLPFFALYSTLQGVHQGHRRFYQLALANALYAAAKLVGVVALSRGGIEVVEALAVNVVASLAGILVLARSSGLEVWPKAPWDAADVRRLLATGAPVGAYTVANLFDSALPLWVLKAWSGQVGDAASGLYVAASNVAVVPSISISVLGMVLLPAVARAVSRGEKPLVRRYIRQAMRLFFLVYVPACLLIVQHAELLMTWIYSERYSDGGALLAVLVVAAGFRAIQAILAWTVIAAGGAVSLAGMMSATAAITGVLSVVLVDSIGAIGAATASCATSAFAAGLAAAILYRRFGGVGVAMPLARIGGAGMAMLLASWWLGGVWNPLAGIGAGVVVYLAIVLATEVTREDFDSLVSTGRTAREEEIR